MDKKKENIKKSLLKQLKSRGNVSDFYIDLVNDYISMWEIKNQLIEDIKVRGVSVPYQNGANQHGAKKNDSIRELTTINRQMLVILRDLGIKAQEEAGSGNFEL